MYNLMLLKVRLQPAKLNSTELVDNLTKKEHNLKSVSSNSS